MANGKYMSIIKYDFEVQHKVNIDVINTMCKYLVKYFIILLYFILRPYSIFI